jgi:hypothetical protein
MADTQVNQTGGGDGRGGLYALLAIVIALLIVALILFIPRGADDGTRDIDIRIETPELPERAPSPDDGGDAGGGNGDGPGG